MKSSTTRWTTAFAAAALLGLPAAGWSQTPATPSPAPSAQQPASSEHGQHGAAQEHIRQAKAALNDVPAASIPASAKNRIAELKRHLNALEKSAGASTTKTTARTKATWANDVAAVDKILTELLGPATTSGASEAPAATGTTGAARSTSKATLDETTKSKLMEVRTHVTAFASAMSGAGGATPGAAESTSAPAAASTTEPSAPAQSSAASSAQSSSTTSEQQSSSSTQQPPPSTTGSQAAQTSQPSAAPSPETSQQQPTQAGSSQGDPQEAKRHLTAARESLSQLTQLPAAAQLQGEARTQVSQLITNFNELITTNTEWRASFEKVSANIAMLLGPESADPAQAQPQAQPPAGTPGAVGTSGAGTTNLDPAIRAKLVEFRTHLAQFEKAAGAGSSAASSTTGSSSTSSSMTTGSMGTTSSRPAPAATTGSSAATGAESTPAASPEQSQSATQQPAASGQDSALRHIEAIEAIVSGRPGSSSSGGASTGSTGAANPTGTTGSSAAAASGITLDRTQVEQIRMHLAELRKAVEKK